MALYATERQQFGMAKESVRGTAESAPSKWYPTRGLPDLNLSLDLLQDNGIRGIQAKYAPISGIKKGEGKIPLFFDPQILGEFCYSLLGSKTSAQQGGTAAYLHTFSQQTGIQPPSYTFFQNRDLNVLKYNRGVVKAMSFKGGVDNLVEVDADVLFENEASGSIGSVSYPTQRYQSFQNVDFKIAGTSNTNVKSWDLKIDNTARALRTLQGSQVVTDIVAPEKINIDGGFEIYFADTTERDKFIANTAVAIRILSIGATIASTYKYTIDINVYEAHYKAFPYGEDQGLLAAKASFEGYYATGSSKAIDIALTNTDTAY
jgi:hypothetical protein